MIARRSTIRREKRALADLTLKIPNNANVAIRPRFSLAESNSSAYPNSTSREYRDIEKIKIVERKVYADRILVRAIIERRTISDNGTIIPSIIIYSKPYLLEI